MLCWGSVSWLKTFVAGCKLAELPLIRSDGSTILQSALKDTEADSGDVRDEGSTAGTVSAWGCSGQGCSGLKELMLLCNPGCWPQAGSWAPCSCCAGKMDLGIYQKKSLVQLSGLPWQLDICSFVFLENYTGLLIASFVRLFVGMPTNPCLSGAVRERAVLLLSRFLNGNSAGVWGCYGSILPQTPGMYRWPGKRLLALVILCHIHWCLCHCLG